MSVSKTDDVGFDSHSPRQKNTHSAVSVFVWYNEYMAQNYEVETTILEVDHEAIAKYLESLGARKILETKYQVDWFRTAGSQEGDDPWYLRIRTDADHNSEMTWKGKSEVLGDARKHQEFNVKVTDREKAAAILIAIGLENYAHQEKYRTSWVLKGWRFDLDTYPNMPPYLEIEGVDEAHIQEAIKLLRLEENKKASVGERLLIQNEYHLDWYNMRF